MLSKNNKSNCSEPCPSTPPGPPPPGPLHCQVRTFKLNKKTQFSELQRIVEAEWGLAPDRQRLWRWSRRQNGTYRPSQPLQLEPEQLLVTASSATAQSPCPVSGQPSVHRTWPACQPASQPACLPARQQLSLG